MLGTDSERYRLGSEKDREGERGLECTLESMECDGLSRGGGAGMRLYAHVTPHSHYRPGH